MPVPPASQLVIAVPSAKPDQKETERARDEFLELYRAAIVDPIWEKHNQSAALSTSSFKWIHLTQEQYEKRQVSEQKREEKVAERREKKLEAKLVQDKIPVGLLLAEPLLGKEIQELELECLRCKFETSRCTCQSP